MPTRNPSSKKARKRQNNLQYGGSNAAFYYEKPLTVFDRKREN